MTGRIGPYRLEHRLGEGGMGTVWAAHHARRGHPVAIKRMREGGSVEQAARNFADEVRAVAALDHPHVVRVEDQGQADGRPWIAMERARGVMERPRSWREAARALDELLQGLAAVHAVGLLHLDVKPSNLLVRDDGSHLLTDFGIAWLRDDPNPDAVTWGSPPYMAPERFDGRPERLGPTTDLYAVGVVAFELLAGGPPFAVAGWTEAAAAHRGEPLPPLLPRFPVPGGLPGWIRTLLAKRPADRFPTAADARQALTELGGEGPVVALGGLSPVVVGPTLPCTAVGEPVPVAELVGGVPRGSRVRPPPTFPHRPRRTTPTAPGGMGLLGLLAVPFVDRPEVTGPLWDALQVAASGGAPPLVRVVGPPGAGARRVLSRFAELAHAEAGATWLRITPDDPPGAWLRHGLGVQGLPPPERAREAVALRLGLPVTDPVVADVADAALRGVDAERATRLVADHTPGLLVVVFHGVTPFVGPAPGRVVVHATHRGTDGIRLEPLDVPTTRALLADWVGLDPALVTDLADRCEGDLGLALEMIREGVGSGHLEAGPTGLVPTSAEPLPLPATARARWRARLPSWSPAERHAVHRAAVAGMDVDVAALQSTLPDVSLAPLVHALVEAGLAVPTATGFRWPSAALRAELIADAGPDAAAHHRACAEVAPSRWARGSHLLFAGDLEPAMDLLFEEASDTIAQGRMVAAARLLDRLEVAMDEARVPAESLPRCRLLRARATLGPTHQGAARTMALNEASAEMARRHLHEGEAWRHLLLNALGGQIWLANVQLLPRVAAPLLEEDRALQGATPSAVHFDRVGWHRMNLGDARGAVEAFRQAVERAEATGNRHIRFVADSALGVARVAAGDPGGFEHLVAAGDAMLRAGYASARADLAAAKADALRSLGDLESAELAYDEALRACAEGDARADVGFVLGRALCLSARGRHGEALATLEGCLDEARASGSSWEAIARVYLAAEGRSAGRPPREEGLPRAVHTLREAGLVQVDVARALRRLDDVPGAAALADAMEEALAWGRRP